MFSFLLPANIQVYCSPDYIIIKLNNKSFIKKTNKNLHFNIIKTSEGDRLFATANSTVIAISALSHMYQLIFGLARGYQQRLRLVGIGFRAIINTFNVDKTNGLSDQVKINSKNYMRNRFITNSDGINQYISIKLGYSHEVTYPVNPKISFNIASLESRSKGRIIDIKSNNYLLINSTAAEIRSFRYPDSYKGKGIYYNKEVLKLKKGKRQG